MIVGALRILSHDHRLFLLGHGAKDAVYVELLLLLL